ncbi:hypothetical protein [Paraburkholderia tuberum]|uniref:Uncharacterized protein n=1 Tax=Paraburkholderia tuberum TaxID=157910 RepID=A0A1H1GDX0_9BURK|nr:hypothetical protein [Paraburkholderia tuberum]SDR11088.1 hypothetical protein SAMN05445850_2837 [Paraburkholderia tuberum]
MNMKRRFSCLAAAALPFLLVAQTAVASDAAPMCQQLRTSGATDIAKDLLVLRSKLPRVPVGQAAAFERASASAMPDAKAGIGSPLYHVWLSGQYLDRATQQIGVIPTATSPVLRALMLADSTNTAAGYVAIATNSLLLGASQRAGAARGEAVPGDTQLGDYALDLQQI